ncbi:MAG TPA: PQQ-binding-like beta-propeller repeat protein [Bryobacteraceae bacterium]|nr:PQQ-binding-like beta-propeller repeat protein [Bryobacteraceae bacterium]
MRCGVFLLVTMLPLTAAQWTRFRGPNGTGIADAQSIPGELRPDKNVAWKIALPSGFSSPVLTNTDVFLTASEETKLFTISVDRKTGKVNWKKEAPKPLGEKPKGPNSPVSPSPVTDGKNVYVFFDNFGLISYAADGRERWRYETGMLNLPYGAGTSPVLHESTVLLQIDQDSGSYLVALDKDTGKVRWKTERPHATHGFSSPVIYQPAKGGAEVIASGAYELDGYDLATGKKLWWVTGMAWQAKSVPVVAKDVVYVHSWMASLSELGHKEVTATWEQTLADHDKDKDGKIAQDESPDPTLTKIWFLYDLGKDGFLDAKDWEYLLARNHTKNGLYAIKLGGRGDVTKSHVLWRVEKGMPNIPSPLVYNDVLFLLREGGILTSFNPKDGSIHKQGRVEGAVDAYFASPVLADGKLITASREGKVAVIKPAAQWEVLSVGEFGEDIWATPAAADRQFFVRTQKTLYCFEAPRV